MCADQSALNRTSSNIANLDIVQGAISPDLSGNDRRTSYRRRTSLDMRQLRYFIAVVDAGSFSRAAEQVHIAQPALSQHVLNMESTLGVSLLQRNARGVVPTEAGLRLLERARNMETQFAELGEHVRGAKVPSGQVRIGMSPTVNEQLGMPLIELCRERYPDVRIRISEAMSGFVADWLKDGTVDFALIYDMPDQRHLKTHHALSEEILLFGPQDIKSAPSSETTPLSVALGLPLVLSGATHALRELIDVAAKSINQRVNPAIEMDSYRQIKRLVAAGYGYGMLPVTAIHNEISEGTFRAWRISQPAIVGRVCLGYRADLPLSLASHAVARLSWNIMQRLVRSESWIARWHGSEVCPSN